MNQSSYLELVGVVIVCSQVTDNYHVDHVYRTRIGDSIEGSAIIKSRDIQCTLGFDRLCNAMEDVYLPAIRKEWSQETAIVKSRYLQFCVGCAPSDVGLEGTWRLYARL